MIFKIIAVVILATFYACYYGKMFIQKKKGIQTTQVGKGKTGFVKAVECTMMAASIVVFVAEIISIAFGTSLLPDWARWIGVGIATLGVGIFILAVLTMRDSWRAGVSTTDKTELVTNGVFSISRNPAFLGFDLVYIGILLMFFNWVLLVVSVFAAIMFHLQIVNVEEEFLLETFGEEYLTYKNKVNRYIGKSYMSKKKAIVITVICILLVIPIGILPTVTAAIYESIFGIRYETVAWREFSVEDYEGLKVERSDFQSEDVTLAGYKYSKADQEIKGVVVIAHGLGGGGHNTYMPFADYFTSNGYYVFAYDVRGNDNSGGDSVEGLPQGLIDLDNAMHHITAIKEYENLPVVLFGHSWGAYSVGNVLNMHPDVKAAVMVAGVNESEDLIKHQGEQMAGAGVHVLMPYLKLYERLKFGSEYTSVSAIGGMEKTDAGIMIVHSKDDTTVPTECGYDKFYEVFGDSNRFEFVLYEDRGHDYLLYSEAAWAYREQINADYKSYVVDNGREYSAETQEEFMNEHLDKKQCFEPDSILMGQILEMYDAYCVK